MLTIIHGNCVDLVVFYKETVIPKYNWCKIYKVWKCCIAKVITHFDKWTLSPNFPPFEPSPEKRTIIFQIVKKEGGDMEPLTAELGLETQN